MELDTGALIEIIRETVTDDTIAQTLIKNINDAEKQAKQELAAEKEVNSGPKAKNKFVVLIRGDSELKKLVSGAYITQVDESYDTATLIQGLTIAAARQNEDASRKKSGRGRKPKNGGVIRSWRELFAWTKAKFTKEVAIKIKSKDAVEVVILDDQDVKFAE